MRNANGYPHNFGYVETSVTLDQIMRAFPRDFVGQLDSVDFCGNFGDFIVNPQALEILRYFYDTNNKIKFYISTNGSARNSKFWQDLGSLGHRVQVGFCIDGLQDTHSRYRLDTNWQTIIDNAQTFINAGGYAIWKMIGFGHNKHQVDHCRQLSKDLGFHRFDYVEHGRDTGPVFDRQGQLMYLIGDANPDQTYQVQNLINWHGRQEVYKFPPEKESLDCYTKKAKSIYMSGDGSIYPCCYLGAFPRTYRGGSFYQAANDQVTEIMGDFNNNVFDVGLEQALAWFNRVEQAWSQKTYQQGRLFLCDQHCGRQYQKRHSELNRLS